jgi:high-affinity nickel-transport protein
MGLAFLDLFDDGPERIRDKGIGLAAVLVAANVGAWVWALVAFRDYPLLLGPALLAYSFGLRHAVDADHIAAIDNVTRTLMQAGRRPVAVGLFFSLGHSTVVVLLSVGIVLATTALQDRLGVFETFGGVFGTLVSASFLLAIAAANLVMLAGLWRRFRTVKAGGLLRDEELTGPLVGGGVMARLFRPLFARIHRSWWMFPLGFLFGLGFDTASEVGLLGISASQASQGLPLWSILVFPALFTAGMALVDTADGILMLGAYGWAFIKPVRKLYYNMTITLISVVVAVLVSGIELLGLFGDQLSLAGDFWTAMGRLNDNFGTIGYALIALFVLSWLASWLVERVRG